MPANAVRADLQPEAVIRLAADNMLPVDAEIDAHDLPVRGKLPTSLNGVLFRNGPNRQFPADAHAHWFTGDGMIHRFEIADGRVAYRNRWIRTPKFLSEREAGRSLGGGFGSGGSIRGGVGNTNIVWHGGKLLALEEAHLPIAMDPKTLDTLGSDDANGALTTPFTAHPHVDPVTGEMIFFGYGADGPLGAGMSWGKMDSAGRVTHFEKFAAPYAAMIHDFAVTQRHVLFPVLPLTASRDRAKAGRPPFAWEPDFGSCFGVLPRSGTAADLRWFRADARYAYHVMNAWEDGNVLHADVMEFPQPALFPNADGSPVDPARTRARLTRWSFDLDAATDQFSSSRLDDLPGEFPRIDDRFTSLPYRHGWYAGSGPGRTGGFDSISHIDHARGQRSTLTLPTGDVPSEPIFVPANASAGEGEGWILSVVWRGEKQTSELVVLEALDVAAGPIAVVELPQRVPFGFHGNFVSAA
jgi:carotenoid cleavage dioxygenase